MFRVKTEEEIMSLTDAFLGYMVGNALVGNRMPMQPLVPPNNQQINKLEESQEARLAALENRMAKIESALGLERSPKNGDQLVKTSNSNK